jgi:hypothetical protein
MWERLKRFFSRFRPGQEPLSEAITDKSGLLTPNGFGISATDGKPQSRILVSTDTCEIEFSPGENNNKDYKCGHSAPGKYFINLYGDRFGEFDDEQDCPDCLLVKILAVTIRCALCGLPIVPGRPVAVYSPRSKGLRLDIATRDGNSVLGCMRWDCCPSGAFYAGHWTGTALKSAFEEETLVQQVIATGHPIAVDLEDH